MRDETFTLATRHGRVAVRLRRSGEPTLLFLHGSGFSKDVFDGQFASARLASMTVAAVDFPGHGASENATDPARSYTFEGLAETVADVIEELDLKRVVVVGWSLGGHVAFNMIGRTPAIAGVLAFGSPPLVPGPFGLLRAFHLSFGMLLASRRELSHAEAVRFEKLTLGMAASGRFVAALQRTDPAFRPAITASLSGGQGRNERNAIATARVPVCLIHGEDDPLVRRRYMEGVSGNALFANRTIIVPKAGHAPFLDRPDTFEKLLADFVSAVSGKQAVSAATG